MTLNRLFIVAWCLLAYVTSKAQNISFGSSDLLNESISNPTSLDFGPDDKLYVSQQNGLIWQFTIKRDSSQVGTGTYTVTEAQEISIVQQETPNHTDSGVPTTIKLRQITGVLAAGTAEEPVIYVTSSDNLIGGGGSADDKNLDTNSGILSKLTWNGTSWEKVDLVRGLPRSEENHSTNGMDLFEKDGISYMLVQQGGHTNKGAPSNNFVGSSEYFLASNLLIINLTQLESMPVYTDPRTNTKYTYDLPTLNDPNREDIDNTDARFPYPVDHPLYNATIDVGDPFGGDDSLNQAFVEAGGPVQIFSPGYRNAYDVTVTEDGRVYTFDNGPNTGWGGLPKIFTVENEEKGDESTTTYAPEDGEFVKNEFNEAGSTGHGDALHYVGTIDDVNGTYYGGHPIPIAAFPSRADLITYKNVSGSWTETGRYSVADRLEGVSGYFNSEFSINDFPDDPRQGKYLADAINSSEVNILDLISSSTNGMCDYTATVFEGAMSGNLLATSFNGNVTRYVLSETGDALVEKEVLFTGFGAIPLDVIATSDTHPFPGTIWVASYGTDAITVFEPRTLDITCPGSTQTDFDPDGDFDNDGFTNQDELDNGTDICSGGSSPKDIDGDLVSDLNDPDDDNDGIPDLLDPFAIDPDDGTTTNLPIQYSFFNNDPGTGLFGLGFTGLMLDPSGETDYITQFDEDNLSFGGAAGKASIDLVPSGDAHKISNTQQNGFQFGVNVDTNSPPFTIHSRVESPFFGINGASTKPKSFQSVGIFIGNGDQDNYLKIVVSHGTVPNDDIDGLEVLLENEGVTSATKHDIPNLLDGNAVDIFVSVNPAENTAQPLISIDGGVQLIPLGDPVTLPASFLDSTDNKGMAVGLISTSVGTNAPPFSAAWDFMNITADGDGQLLALTESVDFGEIAVNTGATLLNVELKNDSGALDGPIEINTVAIQGTDQALFSVDASKFPAFVGPGQTLIVPVTFSESTTTGVKTAQLEITHSGSTEPLSIPIQATVTPEPLRTSPILRINAGGSAVPATDSGPDWIANVQESDTNTAYQINEGSNTSKFSFNPANRHSSIPDYIDDATYTSIFGTERWDPSAAPEMEYSIPVENGNYILNLYMGNGWSGTQEVGQRVFGIRVEDIVREESIDLTERFGHQVGGLVTLPVTVTDSVLNLEFVHIIQHPLINAIEVLAAENTGFAPITISTIDNQTATVGSTLDLAIEAMGGDPARNYTFAISGQPEGLDIEPTNGLVFGTIAENAATGGPDSDGQYTIEVTVSQGGLLSATTTFDLTVTPSATTWIDKDENEDYTARHECSFVQAGDTFIMFGGREFPKQLDVYDYENNTWSQGGEAPQSFNHFQAITYQGLVWVIGAFVTNNFPNELPATHIYMYNPATQEWIQGIEIPENRRRGGAGLVMYNDKFYVVGGNTIGHNGGFVNWFDEYDPTTGLWTVLPDAPNARDHFYATAMNDKLYAIGGRKSGGPGGTFAPLVAQVDVYDFVTQSWSVLLEENNLPTPRAAASVVNFNGEIFVMGGEGTQPGPAFDTVEAYDPTKATWTTKPAMNYPRHGTQAIQSGDGIYIAGGSPNRGGGNQKNMEVFNQDNATGIPIVNSTLTTGESEIPFTYTTNTPVTIPVTLQNTGGNTGIYIKSVSVTGDEYMIENTISEKLIAPDATLDIQVNFTGTTLPESKGTVSVTYSNNDNLTIGLTGTNTTSVVRRINVGGATISASDDNLDWVANDANGSETGVGYSVNSGTVFTQNLNFANRHSSIPDYIDANTYQALFAKARWDAGAVPEMMYTIPVDNADYTVNLYFGDEYAGAAQIGQRIFDITIEDELRQNNFDIVAAFGHKVGGMLSFPVKVTDGELNIEFGHEVQNPTLNAIEVIRTSAPAKAPLALRTTLSLSEVSPTELLQVYPVPATDQLYIDAPDRSNIATIEILDIKTQRMIANQININSNHTVVEVNYLNTGIYLLRIQLDSGETILKKISIQN